ncbi:hypothetical protein [Nonomuraea fuscirosea]|uniref:hypothetical protein n=1 Tax=Nonomuraea fuscirosea TaxID=1291556 RepID=UPI0033CE1DAC
MSVLDILLLLLGLAIAVIAALIAGFVAWRQTHSGATGLFSASAAFGGALTLWLLALQTYR